MVLPSGGIMRLPANAIAIRLSFETAKKRAALKREVEAPAEIEIGILCLDKASTCHETD